MKKLVVIISLFIFTLVYIFSQEFNYSLLLLGTALSVSAGTPASPISTVERGSR